MPLRHFRETQNAGAIGAPLGGNRANPGKHPRGNSGAISGAIGPPPGGQLGPPQFSQYLHQWDCLSSSRAELPEGLQALASTQHTVGIQ